MNNKKFVVLIEPHERESRPIFQIPRFYFFLFFIFSCASFISESPNTIWCFPFSSDSFIVAVVVVLAIVLVIVIVTIVLGAKLPCTGVQGSEGSWPFDISGRWQNPLCARGTVHLGPKPLKPVRPSTRDSTDRPTDPWTSPYVHCARLGGVFLYEVFRTDVPRLASPPGQPIPTYQDAFMGASWAMDDCPGLAVSHKRSHPHNSVTYIQMHKIRLSTIYRSVCRHFNPH